MRQSDGFYPDWASAPGDTIYDVLEARDMPIECFARSLDCSLEDVRSLVQGRVPITVTMARILTNTISV